MTMPVHDWTRVDAGLFHAFHQGWVCSLCDAFNTGGLPPDHFALLEPSTSELAPVELTLRLPPESESAVDARKADRIAVRHQHGHLVAVVEIVSPGNKGSRNELRAFVEK